ncbi:MAG: MBOAT family protein [Deltaproteobacteria bacterium]|nr:MBOAT family protein [Deltaproteobacteria bacterium]
MLFTEWVFYPFFALCFVVYWAFPSNRVRKVWLLACSYFFYGYWDWRFLLLIFASTLIDYSVALALQASEDPRRRRLWVTLSLLANLGVLGFFKYFNFFVSSGAGMLQLLGVEVAPRTLEIILPVGISFFTFQTMSYTIDVYRRAMVPTRDFLDFSLYVGFFPQLVAGPIVRARIFLPQLAARRSFAEVDLRHSLLLFLSGYFKKACVADNIAAGIDPIFANPAAHGAADAAIAAVAYSIQIYCDFAGYTDMAIAVAGLLGYRLQKNFDFPNLSTSIAEFWARWHMSLSTWLRDYVYVSLGGGRGSRAMVYRNLMLTMLIGGLWHGANWTFVLWGGLHGLALVAHRAAGPWLTWVRGWWGALLGWAATFSWVVLCLVVFRCEDLTTAGLFLGRLLAAAAPGDAPLPHTWWLLVAALGALHLATRHWGARGLALCERMSPWAFGVLLGLGASVALFFTPLATTPFIYFQF